MFESYSTIENMPLEHLYIFNGMLIALAILNIYWFYLIMKIAFSVIWTKDRVDIREEDENGKTKENKEVDSKKDAEKKKENGERKKEEEKKKENGESHKK